MAAAGLVADSLAASRWGAWLRTLFTALLTIPAIITPLTPILAPRILPHVFPTADEVMLQNELEAPLIRSAYELQSRLFAMATSNFLIKALETPQPVLIDTAIAGTMYSFARFIAAAERAMEHPDADLGISSSGFFPYRLAPRRQRVNGLIHATMNAMGSRGSSGCTTDLVEMLSESTGATMAVLAEAERAEAQLCTGGSECRARTFTRASHCSGSAQGGGGSLYDLLDDGRMAWAGGGSLSASQMDAFADAAYPGVGDEDLDEAEGGEAGNEGGWEVLAAEQRGAAEEAAGGAQASSEDRADDSCPAEAEERAACSAARVMARHTRSVACDRTLMLRSGQRRAIAELMLLDRGPARRAGQLAVAPIMPFHVFAQLVYPVLAPLYENPGLVSTVVRAKAAVHASSIRRAKQQQLQRLQADAERAASGMSTLPPNPLLWAAVTPLESPPAVQVRASARGTLFQRTLAPVPSAVLGLAANSRPRDGPPASPSPQPGAVQGPWFPSISRAASAAQRATCVLLELLDNSTARAVQAVQHPRTATSPPIAGGSSGLDVAGRRASLIHWLGPLAGDLVRLLDPTMLCVHRERIIRVQNAALELMLVLDAGPQLFVSSKATSSLAAAAGQHSALAMAAHVLVEVGRLPLVVTDWSLQWLGVYGSDAAFTEGVWPAPMPSSRRSSHWSRFSAAPSDENDDASGGSRWKPTKLKRLHASDFKACTDIYDDLQRRQAERAEAELSRSRRDAAAARWRRVQPTTAATATATATAAT